MTPKKNNPPIIETIRIAEFIFVLWDTIRGLKKLSIDEAKIPKRNIPNVVERGLPVANR